MWSRRESGAPRADVWPGAGKQRKTPRIVRTMLIVVSCRVCRRQHISFFVRTGPRISLTAHTRADTAPTDAGAADRLRTHTHRLAAVASRPSRSLHVISERRVSHATVSSYTDTLRGPQWPAPSPSRAATPARSPGTRSVHAHDAGAHRHTQSTRFAQTTDSRLARVRISPRAAQRRPPTLMSHRGWGGPYPQSHDRIPSSLSRAFLSATSNSLSTYALALCSLAKS